MGNRSQTDPVLRIATMFLAWLKASRLPSQLYLALPLVLGQAIAFRQTGKFDWMIFVLVQLFGLCDQLYIVYANDYADLETDRQNRTFTMFSGGSRVLVDGRLDAGQLKHASQLMAGLCVGCALVLALVYGRKLALPLVVASLTLLWMYSYPPLRLNYRGGGEVLQMLGLGVVLPIFGFYAQTGMLEDFPWTVLWMILPTQLACALATALPDEPSDRRSEKRTVAVLLGPLVTKLLIIALNCASLVILIESGWLRDNDRVLFLILAATATSAQLPFLASKPGTLKLSMFVFLAVLVTLSFMVTLIAAFFTT